MKKQAIPYPVQGGPAATTLYIPNHLVNARYNYSLLQERIFNYVIFYCQNYIKQIREGCKPYQLELFSQDSGTDIQIKVPLSHMAQPEQYDQVRESAIKMCSVLVQIPKKDLRGKQWIKYTGFFKEVSIPEDKTRCNYIIATLTKEMAEHIVSIEKRADGMPIHFTTFVYEVAMYAKNKYTPRIYKLISSWKKAGGFYCSVQELRELLDLGDKYRDIDAIKRRILKPVQDELMSDADCWYNCVSKDFEQKDGKKVVGFNFKVISHKQNLHYVKQKEYILHLLKSEYQINANDINRLIPIIDHQENWEKVFYRLSKINAIMASNRDKKITDMSAYVTTSLLREFSEV